MKYRHDEPSDEQLFVRRLSTLDDSAPMEEGEIDRLVRESRIDLAASLAVALEKIAEAKKNAFKSAMTIAQAERTAALTRLKSFRVTRSKAENLELIASLAATLPPQQQALAFHRSFETATEDDLASLAAELELLAGRLKK